MPPKSRKQKQRHTIQDAVDFFDTDYEEERPITPCTKRNYMKNLEWFKCWCFDKRGV